MCDTMSLQSSKGWENEEIFAFIQAGLWRKPLLSFQRTRFTVLTFSLVLSRRKKSAAAAALLSTDARGRNLISMWMAEDKITFKTLCMKQDNNIY